jgi:mycobactin salicyl-AMP ligase
MVPASASAPMGLCALLAAVADRHPARIAFVDQASTAGISGSAAPRNDASSRLIIARAATAVTPPAP